MRVPRARGDAEHRRRGSRGRARGRDLNRKLVVFVPREALDTVRAALFAAGAGRIGNMSAARGTRPGPARTSAVRGRPRSTARPGARSGSRRSGSRPSTRSELEGDVVARSGRPIRTKSRPSTSTSSSTRRRDGTLFTDGGARGNPGPAASAYVIEADDGTVLAAHGEAIGVATNNVAEYRALVAGLERARDLGLDGVEVSDSELLVSRCAASTRSRTRRCASLDRGSPARPGGRRRALHRRAAGAQRACRPPRQRGARRSAALSTGSLPAKKSAEVSSTWTSGSNASRGSSPAGAQCTAAIWADQPDSGNATAIVSP